MTDLLKLEREHWDQGQLVAGVDETGRGALAGPMLAAAVILPLGFKTNGIRDSKKMDQSQREAVYPRILAEAIAISVAWISAAEIDAADGRREYDKCHVDLLQRTVLALSPQPHHVLVDFLEVDLPMAQGSIERGESVSASIAAASIVAKVTRDRMMADLGRYLEPWALATNKGYGTDQQTLVRTHGASVIHRRSSSGVRKAMNLSKPPAS